MHSYCSRSFTVIDILKVKVQAGTFTVLLAYTEGIRDETIRFKNLTQQQYQYH